MPAEMVHVIGNGGKNTRVRITHAKITKNPKIQMERVSAMAEWRNGRGSEGDEGGKDATIAFGRSGKIYNLKSKPALKLYE